MVPLDQIHGETQLNILYIYERLAFDNIIDGKKNRRINRRNSLTIKLEFFDGQR